MPTPGQAKSSVPSLQKRTRAKRDVLLVELEPAVIAWLLRADAGNRILAAFLGLDALDDDLHGSPLILNLVTYPVTCVQ